MMVDDDDLTFFMSPLAVRRSNLRTTLPSSLTRPPDVALQAKGPLKAEIQREDALDDLYASGSYRNYDPPTQQVLTSSQASSVFRSSPSNGAFSNRAVNRPAIVQAPTEVKVNMVSETMASSAAIHSRPSASVPQYVLRPEMETVGVQPDEEPVFQTTTPGGNLPPPMRWRCTALGNPREKRLPAVSAAVMPYTTVGQDSTAVLWTDESKALSNGGAKDRLQIVEDMNADYWRRSHTVNGLYYLPDRLNDVVVQSSGSGVGAMFVQTTTPPAIKPLESSVDGPQEVRLPPIATPSPTKSMFSSSALYNSTTLLSPQQVQQVRVSDYYAVSNITPFRRLQVRREEEMTPSPPSACDATVDSRRVWGPKEEVRYQGMYRAWWQ